MRPTSPILAALLLSLCGLGRPAMAQTAPQTAVETSGDSELRIAWEVKNRFRLFRNEADFQRQVAADQGDGILGAERRLEAAANGRGWAQNLVGKLCVDGTGKLLATCPRDGEQENYLAPQNHRVGVRLVGRVPADATCIWNFDDGTVPPQQSNSPCGEEVTLRLRYGRPTIASVGITRADGSIETRTTEVRVQDILIAGLGDSIAAGEGNPDKPVALADEGFCFRRFLGTGLSEYFRPSRAGYGGNKACDDAPGASASAAAEWARYGARWMSAACHRSLYSYQTRTALALAVETPHIAVTYLPLACTGATIEAGLFKSQQARECPAGARCAKDVAGQLGQLQTALATARKTLPDRRLDLVLLTIGANDVKFSGMVADVIMDQGVERVLFQQAGLIATPAEAQSILNRSLPADFVKLRAALKPMVGGNLERVVYVSYANPAQDDGQPCPGGRDGVDIHPAFAIDAGRVQQVSRFVSDKFLPQLKALARCERGTICNDPETDRMSFVDAHQRTFAAHGMCARAETDPDFDRDCFSPSGESFDTDLVSGATSPLVCPRRPSEFRPYASRARWIRTPNDSYFTAMTFPQGLPASMQPNNLHDATWGATSAVYGGAVHPTAEGYAAMADAALPAARAALDLTAPPAVTAEPLAPPSLEAPALQAPALPQLPALPLPLPSAEPPQ
jgi:lysophospholipase L1-like esterase